MDTNNGIKLNGIAVRNVTGGNYVCDDNPLPVKVIGGGISGGSDLKLPTDSEGNILANLKAVSTKDVMGVNVESVNENVTLGVNIQNSPTFTLGGYEGITWRNGIPVVETGDVILYETQSVFISGSGYNKSWGSVSTGWQDLISTAWRRVRLFGVSSEPNAIFALQFNGSVIGYYPCGVCIDVPGLNSGDFQVSATEGFCGVVNSDTVGIVVSAWGYAPRGAR